MAERELDISPSELIEEQLRALGMSDHETGGKTRDQIVWEKLLELMQEKKEFIRVSEIAKALGMRQNTVLYTLYRLYAQKKVAKAVHPQSGRPCYIPVVDAKWP